jgi:hypothetical protein
MTASSRTKPWSSTLMVSSVSTSVVATGAGC